MFLARLFSAKSSQRDQRYREVLEEYAIQQLAAESSVEVVHTPIAFVEACKKQADGLPSAKHEGKLDLAESACR